MTEKHNWISDDLCLMEESTGVKLFGTVCTDIRFIANQLNDANQTILKLEKKNKQLESEIKDLNDVLARYEEKYGDINDFKD